MLHYFETANNPAPAGAQPFEVLTADGKQLRAFVGNIPDARGTVVFLNGRADYIERYFESMREAQSRGFAVAAFDWRGQGGSQRLLVDRRRGFVTSFKHFDDDLTSFLAQVVFKHCPKPYYVIAHSTGGQVLLRHLREATPFRKAVTTSPLIDFNYGLWPMPIVHLINAITLLTGLHWLYLPGYRRMSFTKKDFKRNPLTSDQRRYDRDMDTAEKHPELTIGGPTYAWLRAAMSSFAELRRWPKSQRVSCPLLMVTAGNETVVHARAARAFAENVPGISFMQIEGAKHEILMERDPYRKPFWAAFDAFIAD